ncbi:hypothetical protein PYW08_004408 [Mythimna loreyi]|uniref:Uncharacterized protein n=1 Tax=Mythimna loreyi TaxID=667449 RepID=A0ACC2QPE5_9NEOP|nr:hypothetical protein PYW08_004408 [Mythimna loreyi]
MMRGAGGALAVAVAALLVCCSADPHQEPDLSGSDHNSGERYETAGHKTRTLDSLGRSLVRAVREIRPGYVPYLISRRFDFASTYGGKRTPWPLAGPFQFRRFDGDDLPKRNFDEIDRSELDTFVKRNFDEIDSSLLPFPYVTSKRFNHQHQPNDNYLDTLVSSFDKKRYKADYPMDEIDLSPFPIGSKSGRRGFSGTTQHNHRPLRVPLYFTTRTQLLVMMRGAGVALAVAVAALLVCCSADPLQEQDLSGSDHNSGQRRAEGDDNSDDSPTLDSLGPSPKRERKTRPLEPNVRVKRIDEENQESRRTLDGDELNKLILDESPGKPKPRVKKTGRRLAGDLGSLLPFLKEHIPHILKMNRRLNPQEEPDNRNYISSLDNKKYKGEYPMDEIDFTELPIGSLKLLLRRLSHE